MQVTEENAKMLLKPGMMAIVLGEKLQFKRYESTPQQLFFQKPNAKEYESGLFIDLALWKNPPVFTIG